MRPTHRKCKYCGDFHAFDAWPHNCLPPANWNRSDYPAPNIQTDSVPGGVNGMRSMADGRFYTSKAKYYDSVKRAGAHIVEANEPHMSGQPRNHAPKAADVLKDVRESKAQLESAMLSNDEMANMVRAYAPQEPIIPDA